MFKKVIRFVLVGLCSLSTVVVAAAQTKPVDAEGLRPDGERGTEAQHPGHPRLRSESHVGPAQMVRGFEVVENFGTSRLVYLARRQSSRRTAQQLALHVWAFRLEARPEDESVL